MGLLVDLDKTYNKTRSDLKDVYIRIDTLHVFPRRHAIRANVSGYVNKDSGYMLKKLDIEEVRAVEQFFYTNPILNGDRVKSMGGRDEVVPPQTINEPEPVFRDYYTIYLLDEDGNLYPEWKDVKLFDVDTIFGIFYERMKEHESRFKNIRDVIDDPTQEELEAM